MMTLSKYWIDSNPEAWARLWSELVEFDDVGFMISQGVIDVKDMYELSGDSLNRLWDKYQPVIYEMRKRNDSKTMDWFEYLITEMNKEKERTLNN